MTESRVLLGTSNQDAEDSAAAADRERPIGRRREDRVVAASASGEKSLEEANAAARTELTTLVIGPAGSGKKHIARAIHAWSRRADKPLVTFSATGIPESHQERELFGAPPNAEPLLSGEREGALARARHGMLFIDHIDRLAEPVRGALLCVIRDESYAEPLTGETVPLGARILASSDAGGEQLFDGVAVQVVKVDALSARREDILPLSTHFLAHFADEDGTKPVGFTADARRWLVEESWPGNVRELRERVRQAIQLSGEGAVSAEALMLATDGDEVPSFKEAKRAFETRYVEGLLRRCSGNISRAARLARKDRKDFYDVIRRTGVDPTLFRP